VAGGRAEHQHLPALTYSPRLKAAGDS
jgi:hypothetical protein